MIAKHPHAYGSTKYTHMLMSQNVGSRNIFKYV